MFWLRNNEVNFPVRTLIWRPALLLLFQCFSITCLAALQRHGECLALVNKRLETETDNPDLYVMRARLHEMFRNVSIDTSHSILGGVAQSVTCLATDESLAADPGVASSIPAPSHTFVEIDHEMISTSFSSFPLNHSRRVVVSYKRKYVHEVLVQACPKKSVVS